MKRLTAALLLTGMLAYSSASNSESGAIARLEVAVSFGGASGTSHTMRFGTSYFLEETAHSEVLVGFLPVTGLGFDGSWVGRPVVLGVTPSSVRLGAAEEGGSAWGWWAAGAGIAVAAALASSSGSDRTVDGEDGNVTECGVGGGGGLIPVIDLNCLP